MRTRITEKKIGEATKTTALKTERARTPQTLKIIYVLDDLNQEKYRKGEEELRARHKRPRSQIVRLKQLVRYLKTHGKPPPSNWD